MICRIHSSADQPDCNAPKRRSEQSRLPEYAKAGDHNAGIECRYDHQSDGPSSNELVNIFTVCRVVLSYIVDRAQRDRTPDV